MTAASDAPVFLIGYRGTGKTAVASELASRLNYDWIDADDQIEQRSGKSIAAIFAEQGEPSFRDWESRIVSELAGRRRSVVALGGGAVLREENRRAIANRGPVIWLTASVESIVERIAGDEATARRRPNLTASGGRAEVEQLLAQRTPFYRECATLTVNTDGKSVVQVANDIVAGLSRSL
jgi:shikimate kinase